MSIEALFTLGSRSLAAGRFEEAARFFQEALALNDQVPELWNNLGIALFRAGERQEALRSFERSVALAPGLAQLHSNLGHFLAECGELELGLAACRRALDIDPGYVEAHNNAGTILATLHRQREALESFTLASELAPGLPQLLCNRAGALRELGRYQAAAADYRKALAAAPWWPEALSGLSSVHQQRGEIEQAVSLLREAQLAAPDHPGIHSNLIMSLNYSDRSGQQELAEESRLWGCLHGERAWNVPPERKRFLGRRIRIGYLSGDLHQHPVGTFLREVLKHHDKTNFEITCYQNDTHSDRVTAELRRHTDRWFCIVGLSDAEAFELIKSNEIDILVDLSGHTGGNRLQLVSRRPAPVQATWLGYSHSTGVPAIDYLITDAVTVPFGEEHFYSERVVRLPHSRFCYAPPAPCPFVDELSATANGFITFGSFNNVMKLTPQVIALWSRVLLAVPGSKLVLKWKSLGRAAVRKSFLARFARHGVAAERIECRGSSSHYLALAEYNDIDIALDPFPFTGGLTSCEAMWMGVPVLTLLGATPIGRQTASFLGALGLSELVCRDEEEYVAKAAALASDFGRLALLREGLRDRMAGSPLCDGAGFARALEDAFRTMLREQSVGGEQVEGATGNPDLPAGTASGYGAPVSTAVAAPPAAPVAGCTLPAPRPRFAASPRQRLRVAYLVPREGIPAAAEPLLGAAALHDREGLELLLYTLQAPDSPEPAAAAGAGLCVRWIGDLSEPLLARLLVLDRIDVLVDLGQAPAPAGGALLHAAVPVRLGLEEALEAARVAAATAPPAQDAGAPAPAAAAAALESRYREGWLSWFVAQEKPRKRRGAAGIPELVQQGRASWQAGNLEEAERTLAHALMKDPRSADALVVLGAVLVYQWRLAEGIACFKRALVLDPSHVKARSSLLFALNYSDRCTDREIHAQSRAWGKLHSRPTGAGAGFRPAFTGAAQPERPLRVGYLSADFRSHSVSFFLEPLLVNHHPGRIQTFCYSCVEQPDQTTARLRAAASVWRDCAELEDPQIADLVREDRIDILVDLAGHSGARIRLPVFAEKPAPIQVSWLGYPNTTGVAAIDYRLTDACADPDRERGRWYTEKLVRLPDGFLCYRPPEYAPEPGPLPCIANGFVTFGSFNMLPKLSDSTVDAWAHLLGEVAGSRLILKCHPLADAGTRERVLAAFVRRGIDPERIGLVPVLPVQEHLALYHEVDLALDPFPYNGTTTTCEALWMGVPVVTLAGERHAGRVGKSILHRVGLDELVARDREAYLVIAAALSRDLERLSRYRGGLREAMAASPLCDGALFAGHVEEAYREMWRSWCRAQSADGQVKRRK